jgi:hypothetical protein
VPLRAAGVRATQGRWHSLSAQASASCASDGNVHVQAVLESVWGHRDRQGPEGLTPGIGQVLQALTPHQVLSLF